LAGLERTTSLLIKTMCLLASDSSLPPHRQGTVKDCSSLAEP
jgi:hypothetical protein